MSKHTKHKIGQPMEASFVPRRFYDLSGIIFEKETPRKMINLTRLPGPQKRAIWQELKRTRPALAGLLHDPLLAELVATFNAEILIEE